MPSLPDPIVSLLSPFASLFDARTWRKVQILLTGVILAPGRRTVTSALYALGLQAEGDWARYHHVLSRASWSSLEVSRVLLAQLVQHLAPTGPPPQDDHGLGPPDAVPPAPLAARPGAGGRRGPDLRHPEAAGRLPGHDPAHHLPAPAAPGCRPP